MFGAKLLYKAEPCLFDELEQSTALDVLDLAWGCRLLSRIAVHKR